MYKIGLFFSLISLSLLQGMDIDSGNVRSYTAIFKSSKKSFYFAQPRSLSIDQSRSVEIKVPKRINIKDLQLTLSYCYFGLKGEVRRNKTTVMCDMRPLEKLLTGSLTSIEKLAIKKFLKNKKYSENFQEVHFCVNNTHNFSCKVPKNEQILQIVFKTECKEQKDSSNLAAMLMGPASPMPPMPGSMGQKANMYLFRPSGLCKPKPQSIFEFVKKIFSIPNFNFRRNIPLNLPQSLTSYVQNIKINHVAATTTQQHDHFTRIDRSSIL